MTTFFKALTIIGLGLLVAACGTTVNIEDGELVINSNFSLSETMINSADNSDLSFNNTDFVRNAEYDIQDGQIVISGDILCEDSTRAAGSATIEMSTTENGFINVEMTDIRAECEYDEELVERAQTELANNLAEAARELEDSEASLTFTEVTLADDTITIAIEVRAPLNNQQ